MTEYKIDNFDLFAEIYYLTEEEKGREYPVFDGYNGQFYYNQMDWDAIQKFTDIPASPLGERINVKIRTQSPYFHTGQFWIGREFKIREGQRIVGIGNVLEILKPDFQHWTYLSFFDSVSCNNLKYDKMSVRRFISYLTKELKFVKELQKIDTKINLSNEQQMVEFNCKATAEANDSRWLLKKIYLFWINELLRNVEQAHSKVIIEGNRYVFEFAVLQNDNIITGKINIKR